MESEGRTEALRLTATAHRQRGELDGEIDTRLRSAQLVNDGRRVAELEEIQLAVRRVRTLVEELGRALKGSNE